MQYTVIIPTLNAGEHIGTLIGALQAQTVKPVEIIVIDSQSEDGTVALAKNFDGVRVLSVMRDAFDHGGTRDEAMRASETPFAVLMTQDALPADDRCMAALLEPFKDELVAAVCARQVAGSDATARESAIRRFRYPDESRKWTCEDMSVLGIRSFLLSDSCAAYRRSAYESVGGFTHPIETNEDMLIAADFLRAGYALVYQAEARVLHAHNYSLLQEYRRNRKIGAFLVRYSERFQGANETREGMKLVRFVTGELAREGRLGEVIPFWANCGARLLGNRMGRRLELRTLKREHG